MIKKSNEWQLYIKIYTQINVTKLNDLMQKQLHLTRTRQFKGEKKWFCM